MTTSHVTIKLPKELVAEMDKLQGKHGFRGRGEIAKEAIRQFLDKYEADLKTSSRFEKINNDENGVKILDRTLGDDVKVYIKPNGIICGYDKTDNCEHIQYALTFPEVRQLIKKHRKEGWKLPEV